MRYEKIYLEDHFPNLPPQKEKTSLDKPENVTDSARYCSEWFGHCVKWIKEIL